jgi:acetyl esterase/lipase
MPLDPDLVPLVQHLYGATFEQLASGELKSPPLLPAPVEGIVVDDRELPGRHGAIPVRCYRPDRPASGPVPALVWNHGGGWLFGDLDMPEADAVCRRVALALDGVCISVDYRLAPAHHYPVPMDDVVAAYEGAATDILGLGIDPTRVALGGASAGANLAAGAALVLRDAQGKRPAALLLAYPATDPIGGPYPPHRPKECPTVMWLDGPIVTGLFSTYLGPDAGDPDTIGAPAVPGVADLTELPPTLVTTAGYDALKPQADRFVVLLRKAGVDVEHHDLPALLHGYLNMVGSLPAADEALRQHTDWLRQVLA